MNHAMIVGDFSSLNLLVVEAAVGASFRDRAHAIQRQLWEDMSHRLVSGVQVLRELARRGKPARMPIVFTGAVSLGTAGRDASGFSGMGTLVTSITQTPQVWLDHQTYEQEGRLVLNWDAVEGLFPEGLVEDMFDAYVRLLNRLAADDAAWLEAAPLTSAPGALHVLVLRHASGRIAAPRPLHLREGRQGAPPGSSRGRPQHPLRPQLSEVPDRPRQAVPPRGGLVPKVLSAPHPLNGSGSLRLMLGRCMSSR